MEIATLGCAVSVKLTEDKKHIQDLRLAYGVAAPTPIRCHTTEESVKGMETGEALAQAVGKGALEEVNPAFQLEGFQGVQAAAGGGAGQACRKAGRNQCRR